MAKKKVTKKLPKKTKQKMKMRNHKMFKNKIQRTNQNWFLLKKSMSSKTRTLDNAKLPVVTSDVSPANNVSSDTPTTKKDVSDILSQDSVSSNTQPPAISAPDGSGEDVTDSDVDTNTTSNATTADTIKAVCEELPEESSEPWLSRKPSSTSKNIKPKQMLEMEINLKDHSNLLYFFYFVDLLFYVKKNILIL